MELDPEADEVNVEDEGGNARPRDILLLSDFLRRKCHATSGLSSPISGLSEILLSHQSRTEEPTSAIKTCNG